MGREAGARRALLRNLATSVVLFERVRTTEAKAKEIRPFVERLVTMGKQPTLTARRRLAAVLQTDGAVRKILEVLGPRYATRSGGYTRIIKLGRRRGDAAPMAQIEFV